MATIHLSETDSRALELLLNCSSKVAARARHVPQRGGFCAHACGPVTTVRVRPHEQPAVNDLFLLAFATRRDGPAGAQVRTAAELLGGATEPQAKAVLSAVRKVILKWCSRPRGLCPSAAVAAAVPAARPHTCLILRRMPWAARIPRGWMPRAW